MVHNTRALISMLADQRFDYVAQTEDVRDWRDAIVVPLYHPTGWQGCDPEDLDALRAHVDSRHLDVSEAAWQVSLGLDMPHSFGDVRSLAQRGQWLALAVCVEVNAHRVTPDVWEYAQHVLSGPVEASAEMMTDLFAECST